MKKMLILMLAVLFLTGCGKEEKLEQVVWYVDENCFAERIKEQDLYKPIKNEKTDAVNDRLKEMGKTFQIVFKAYSSVDVMENKSVLEVIKEQEDTADILLFDPNHYQDYEILDQYFETKEGKELQNALSEKFWEIHKVNHHTMQVPKPGIAGYGTSLMVDKKFMEKHQLTEEKLQNMGIENLKLLKSVAENDEDFRTKYTLTHSNAMDIRFLFRETYTSLMPNGALFEGILIRTQDAKVVNCYEEEVLKEQMAMYQMIYKEDLDDHIQQKGVPYICYMSDSYPKEFYKEKKVNEKMQEIPIGKNVAEQSVGYGIAKESTNKELAWEALATVYTDSEISNILIHGIEGTDYHLVDGHVVYEKDMGGQVPFGTFIGIGNNLIAFPTEAEPEDKKEITEKSWEALIIKPEHGFVPDWKPIEEKFQKVEKIYEDAKVSMGYQDIGDLNQFYETVNTQLKEAGLEEVILELQRQLDQFMEETNGTQN